ncbi:MAG: hypothetical protein KDC83_04595 [Flavobacteriales bacterium]|nr:hypothetical protein [Flavobacteriales bacterium]
MKNTIFILITSLVLLSCSSQKNVPNEATKNATTEQAFSMKYAYFIISEGGGFTGEYQTYKIQNSGDVFSLNNESKFYEKIGTFDKNAMDAFSLQINALDLESLDLNQPGNISFSIEIPLKSDVKKLTWSEERPAPEKIQTFYSEVKSAIRLLK